MYIGTVTMEISMEFLKKLKIKLPYDPAIPLVGIYLEKNIIQKDTIKLKKKKKRYMHSNVYCSAISNSQDMEAT